MMVKDSHKYIVNVLYTHSTDTFKSGYDWLRWVSPSRVNFVKETNFKEDLLGLMDIQKPYTVFFVDDIVFKEPFEFYDEKMRLFIDDMNIACLSLRLGRHLDYCYALNKPMKQPVFDENNVFDWRKQEGDYGYPMSQDGHIFRTEDIWTFHKELKYTQPNMLEGQLVHKRGQMGRYMICYDTPKIVNNAINRVQDVSLNRCGNVTAESLNAKYLDGFIINIAPFLNMNNKSVHVEVPIEFIEDEGIRY